MNPTNEQLDLWSAEAMGWTFATQGTYMGYWTTPHGFNQLKVTYSAFAWNPSTDLSQAWREFIPALRKRKLEMILLDDIGIGVTAQILDPLPATVTLVEDGAEEKQEDKKAAYTVTHTFVQAMKPAGYLEWKESQ